MKKLANVISAHGPVRQQRVEVATMTPKIRLSRATTIAFIAIFIAIGTLLFAPGLRFFVPPLVLIVAGIYLFRTFKYPWIFAQQNLECPNCHANVELKRRVFRNEIKTFCPSCRFQIRVKM